MARWRLAPGQIRMRELIDQENLGVPGKCGIQIKLAAGDVAVANGDGRQALQAFGQSLGLDPAVRFDIAQHHIRAGRAHSAGGLEHRVGLSDSGGRAEENPQPATPCPCLLGLDVFQQLIRVWSSHHAPRLPAACRGSEAIECQVQR
jgi:hypothetical protein